MHKIATTIAIQQIDPRVRKGHGILSGATRGSEMPRHVGALLGGRESSSLASMECSSRLARNQQRSGHAMQ